MDAGGGRRGRCGNIQSIGAGPHKAYCEAFEFMLYLRQKTCATDGASSR